MSQKRTPKKPASDKPEGYVFGRPTDYKPEYCEQLVEWMKQGNSFPTFGTSLTPPVCDATLYVWLSRYPDFLEAKKLGKAFEMQFLERLHLRCMATGEGNPTAIVWAQKNRCRKYYKERAPKGQQQIQLNASMDVKQLVANMQPEQMAQLIAAIEAKTMQLEEAKETT